MSGESKLCFVDTNVLVYSRDAAEPDKNRKALEWLNTLWQERLGRVSVQVLNEYYVTVTGKFDPGMPKDEARADVRDLWAWNPIAVDSSVVESAWKIQDRFAFSFWDSLIVAAAKQGSCKYLLSEDLQHEQDLGGLLVLNPFELSPDHLG